MRAMRQLSRQEHRQGMRVTAGRAVFVNRALSISFRARRCEGEEGRPADGPWATLGAAGRSSWCGGAKR